MPETPAPITTILQAHYNVCALEIEAASKSYSKAQISFVFGPIFRDGQFFILVALCTPCHSFYFGPGQLRPWFLKCTDFKFNFSAILNLQVLKHPFAAFCMPLLSLTAGGGTISFISGLSSTLSLFLRNHEGVRQQTCITQGQLILSIFKIEQGGGLLHFDQPAVLLAYLVQMIPASRDGKNSKHPHPSIYSRLSREEVFSTFISLSYSLPISSNDSYISRWKAFQTPSPIHLTSLFSYKIVTSLYHLWSIAIPPSISRHPPQKI